MSLNAHEQQALDSIKDGLARADPGLHKLLATFTRMSSGEQMPAHEDIPARSRRGIRYSRSHRRHPRWYQIRWRVRRARQHLSIGLIMSMVWLLLTAVLLTVALTLNRSGNQRTCPPAWSVACPSPSSVHGSPTPQKTTPTGASHSHGG